jgi:hypoxanthine-guanine phosphoribosyltransferase
VVKIYSVIMSSDHVAAACAQIGRYINDTYRILGKPIDLKVIGVGEGGKIVADTIKAGNNIPGHAVFGFYDPVTRNLEMKATDTFEDNLVVLVDSAINSGRSAYSALRDACREYGRPQQVHLAVIYNHKGKNIREVPIQPQFWVLNDPTKSQDLHARFEKRSGSIGQLVVGKR